MGSLEGRYGRRLARLEELAKKARLEHLGQQWIGAIDQLTDEELVVTLRVFDRFTYEGRQDQLVDEAAMLEELEGEEHAAWAAYISVGAHGLEEEFMRILKGLPEAEHEALLQAAWGDPRIRERVRALPPRYGQK